MLGSFGNSSIPKKFISTISTFLVFNISFIISSFSSCNIEQVEYTNSLPFFKISIAFLINIFCDFIDLFISSFVKVFSNFTSLIFIVPLPLQGASNKILSNEKKLSFSYYHRYIEPL